MFQIDDKSPQQVTEIASSCAAKVRGAFANEAFVECIEASEVRREMQSSAKIDL